MGWLICCVPASGCHTTWVLLPDANSAHVVSLLGLAQDLQDAVGIHQLHHYPGDAMT